MMWFHLPSSRELNRRVRETMLSYAASDFFHKEALSDGVWRGPWQVGDLFVPLVVCPRIAHEFRFADVGEQVEIFHEG